jgi:peptide/nickel transport system substrate-binding protein
MKDTFDKIETPDDETIVFILKQPLTPFLAYLANPYAAIVAKENVEDGSIKTNPIGTGPFMFKEWVSGDHITMVKNPKYYKPGLPYLDEVIYRVVTEDSAWFAALRSKKMDLTYHYEGAFMRNIRKIKGLNQKKWMPLGYGGLFFSFTRPPFDNEKLRLAVSYAIDRQDVLDIGFLGEGSVTAPLPESLGYPVPLDELTGYKQDYTKAKALMKEAGYADGLTIKLLTAGDFPYYLSVCQVIQDQLKNIGIKVEIITMEWGTFIGQLFSGEGFDAYFIDIAPFPPDPDIYALRMHYSQGMYNVGGFSDPTVDKLIEQGRTAQAQSERQKAYVDLQHRLADTVACIYLFRTQFSWIMQPWVKGDFGNPLTGNFEYIWIDK